MILFDGEQHLGRLIQKSVRYQNTKRNLGTFIIPKGLKIKKVLVFQLVSEDFFKKREELVCNAKKNLVGLFFYDSSKVIAKMG